LNIAGKCPVCGSDNTDYALIIDEKETSMGHGAIWCNDCSSGFHISRIKINKAIEKEIPKNIKF
jgi:formate dehydrogenase maturation protein FdhE